MPSSTPSNEKPRSSDLATAIAIVDAVFRLFYNEKPERVMQAVYGDPHLHESYLAEKIGVAYLEAGGLVRWVGSLDPDSMRRLVLHSITRECQQLDSSDPSWQDIHRERWERLQGVSL